MPINSPLMRNPHDHLRPLCTKPSPMHPDKHGHRALTLHTYHYHDLQDALAALRELNNSPNCFGPTKRPIVAFAWENAQTLRKREQLKQQQQHSLIRPAADTRGSAGKNVGSAGKAAGSNKSNPTERHGTPPLHALSTL